MVAWRCGDGELVLASIHLLPLFSFMTLAFVLLLLHISRKKKGGWSGVQDNA
jgi:hypothetical protein